MTIEARTGFLGVPLIKVSLRPGDQIAFSSYQNHFGISFPIDQQVSVIDPDTIELEKNFSALKKTGVGRDGIPSLTRQKRTKDEISGIIIPNRIPGVRTELRWRESSLGERMVEALWNLAESGKIENGTELLQVTQNYERSEIKIRLSREFKRLLQQNGVNNPPLSGHDSREIEIKVAKEFLKNLDISPKGLLGGWKTDEQTWTTDNGRFGIKRTIQPNEAYDSDAPVIVYTFRENPPI